MAPSIALNALRKSPAGLIVLDPMVGSGTTIVAARKSGHCAVGFDTDPLAALLARVATSNLDYDDIIRTADTVMSRARSRIPSGSIADAYPKHADSETKSFIRYWFDPHSRRELCALSNVISLLREPMRSVMWCAFSRLIIAKERGVSRARDLSHSRPHRSYDKGPIVPFEHFIAAAAFIAENIAFGSEDAPTPKASVKIGDARKLPLDKQSVDLVVTSPPYLNAIDYVRCSKFSLVWMGHTISSLRELRSTNIGSEASLRSEFLNEQISEICEEVDPRCKLPERERAVLARYVKDMSSVVSEIGRVLKPTGKAVVVIGNSNIRGLFVENSLVVRRLFEFHGLTQRRCVIRDLPPNRRYMPPPAKRNRGSSMLGRMRQEVVLTFRHED